MKGRFLWTPTKSTRMRQALEKGKGLAGHSGQTEICLKRGGEEMARTYPLIKGGSGSLDMSELIA